MFKNKSTLISGEVGFFRKVFINRVVYAVKSICANCRVDLKNYFLIAQPKQNKQTNCYKKKLIVKFLKKSFSYNSKDNKCFLKVNTLRELILKIDLT